MHDRTTSRFTAWLVAIFLIAFTLPCFAREVAVLKNGFTIAHERREVVGGVTRLYVTNDGASFVDVPTTEIDHYEAAPDLPAPSDLASYAQSKTAASAPAAAQPVFPSRTNGNLTDVVNEASGHYKLDPDLVNSVIKAESGFNVHAISPKGAQGLMQLMPGTAAQLGVPNTFDPQQNVEGGTKYLRELLERYNFDLVKALAAYNAGPQRVEQFGGVPPYYETRAYVARVVKDFNKKKTAAKKPGSPSSQKAASDPNAGHKSTASATKSHNATAEARAGASKAAGN